MRTLEIDIRFDGGDVRLKKAAGVSERRTVVAMEAMLRLLWEQPENRKFVYAVIRNERLLTDLYIAYVAGKLTELPAIGEDRALEPTVDEWLAEFQASESHRQRCRQALKKLIGQVRYAAKLSDLPALLTDYRSICVRNETPRAFNYAKQASLALVRDKLGKRHPLRASLADVVGMTEAKQGVAPLTVADAKAVRDRILRLPAPANTGQRARRVNDAWPSTVAEAARTWWAMCCTGMGATEFWGQWTPLEDRVRIVGTKRPGRRWGSLGREVPLVCTLTRPTLTPTRFADILRLAGASPYQGRHSYATWLEDAEIPRTRRMLYLGHAGKDITDRYERREITAFLAEDRARLLSILGPDTTLQLSRSHGLVLAPMAQEA